MFYLRLTLLATFPARNDGSMGEGTVLRGEYAIEGASVTVPTECWVLPRPRKDAYVGSFPLHFEKKLHRLLGEPRSCSNSERPSSAGQPRARSRQSVPGEVQ
jgi:hypothetical protein